MTFSESETGKRKEMGLPMASADRGAEEKAVEFVLYQMKMIAISVKICFNEKRCSQSGDRAEDRKER